MNEEFKISFTIKNIFKEPWGKPIYFKLKSNPYVVEFINITPLNVLKLGEEVTIVTRIKGLKEGFF